MRELGVPVTALQLSGNPGSFAALVRCSICARGKFDVIQDVMYHANLAGWSRWQPIGTRDFVGECMPANSISLHIRGAFG